MHNYGILKREGIVIDNSVIKGNGINPYDVEFVKSISKYARGTTLPYTNSGQFVEGIDYRIEGKKFTPSKILDKEPRVLFVVNDKQSFLPRYTISGAVSEKVIKTLDTYAGYELCIIHEDFLSVYADGSVTVTRTFNLDDGMMASYVVIKQNNQTIILSESL